MPEEQLFESEEQRSRVEIADVLAAAADGIEAGSVELGDGAGSRQVAVPETTTFEVELERVTDAETGEQRYELEYELHWTE